jgi:hypothetical protein
MPSQAPNLKHPQSDLRQKIERAITALSELSDTLPSGDDRSPMLGWLEALHVEHQANPVSRAALKKICEEVSNVMGKFEADLS